jgi:hypothetical protein
MVTFTTWAIGSGFAQRYLDQERKKQRWLMRCAALLGVNGDDLVYPDTGVDWERGVKAVNGKVSRGKSLRSKFAFTVNSELWTRKNPLSPWIPPAAIRPSLAMGIWDGRRAVPEVLWAHMARSPLIDESMKRLLSRRLKTHLPVSLGGLGTDVEFVFQDVKEAMKKRCASIKRKTYCMMTPVQEKQLEEDKDAARYLVDKRFKKFLTGKIRAPYLRSVQWTDAGTPDVSEFASATREEARQFYFSEVQKEKMGLVEMLIPSRVANAYPNLLTTFAPVSARKILATRHVRLEFGTAIRTREKTHYEETEADEILTQKHMERLHDKHLKKFFIWDKRKKEWNGPTRSFIIRRNLPFPGLPV